MSHYVVRRVIVAPDSPALGPVLTISESELMVTLDRPATGPTRIDRYELQRSADGAETWAAIASGLGIFPYDDSGLAEATQYHYRARAVDTTARESEWSYSAGITGTGAVNQAPVWDAFSLTIARGNTASIAAYASDPDGVQLSFSRIGGTAPAAVTCSVAGIVNVDAAVGAGSYTLQLRASDGELTADTTVDLTVTSSSVPAGTLLSEDFSSPTWYTKWHNTGGTYPTYAPYASAPARCMRVTPSYTGEGYAPNPSGSGYALRVQVTQGRNDGTNLSFYPRLSGYGINPTELYLEYWIRFGSTWNPVINGKLPGLAGDFNDGAKGNAWAADGMNGWSARSGYGFDASRNLPEQIPGSTYFYYVECGDRAGEPQEYSSAADPGQGKTWSNMGYSGSAVMLRNTWRKIRIYAKANTGSGASAQRNGRLKVWVDDIVRLDFTQIMYTRNSAYQFVERAWMNIYHGGTAVATSNLHAFISDVRIWVP